MSNLKPAPLPFTPDLVAKLVGDRPAYGKGIVRVPVEGAAGGCRKCGQTCRTELCYSPCPLEERADG